MRKNILNTASIAAMVAFAANNDEGNGDDTDNGFDQAYIDTVKEGFKEATGKSLPIKDELLAQILSQHKDFDGMETEQQLAFLKQVSDEVAKVSIADPAISVLVGKIDETAKAEFLSCVDAVIKGTTSALDVMAQFRRIYTKAELDGMAFPGLEKDKMEPGDNRKPDIVTTKLKNGDEITTKWTDDYCSTWPPVKAWEADIDDAKKERKSSGSVPRLKHLGKRELANLLRLATKKRNAFRSMVKRAITCHHQLAAIEMMPEVVLEFSQLPKKDTVSKHVKMPVKYGLGNKLKDEDCIKVTLAPSPFWMYPKGQSSDGKDYSVTQINNMDVRAAIAAGGEMNNLTDTIAKGADDTEDTETTGAEADIEEAYNFTVKTANWFARRENVAAVRKVLSDPKHAEHDDWLQLVGDIAVAILPTYRRNKAAYEKLSETAPGTAESADTDVTERMQKQLAS